MPLPDPPADLDMTTPVTSWAGGHTTPCYVPPLYGLLSPVDEPTDRLDRACTWAIRIGVAAIAFGLVALLALLCGMVVSLL